MTAGIISALALLASAAPDQPGAAPGPSCLRYGPDTVAVAGVLERHTYPGRPNYESVAGGDEPESGFCLRLPAPVCTEAGADPDLDVPQRGVRLVQLVLDRAGYARLRPSLGRRVVLRGTLFAAHTGHHHAPLLLQVAPPAPAQAGRRAPGA